MKNQHNNRYFLRGWLFIAFPLLAIVMFFAVRMPAQADTIVNQVVPISFALTNPCNGEAVTFSGNEHITSHLTFDGSGGVHIGNHVNFQDVTGAGSFGNKYQIPAVENQSFNAKVGQEETETVSELVVSQGSAPNFVVKFDFHTTINPDGTVTSYFNNFTTECRG